MYVALKSNAQPRVKMLPKASDSKVTRSQQVFPDRHTPWIS